MRLSKSFKWETELVDPIIGEMAIRHCWTGRPYLGRMSLAIPNGTDINSWVFRNVCYAEWNSELFKWNWDLHESIDQSRNEQIRACFHSAYPNLDSFLDFKWWD